MSGAGAPDFFYREAQRLGYVARSAFKLLQMQKQYKLIKPGSSVLDLGCAPGAWLQVCGLKWSHDDRELASGGHDNQLLVWNQHSQQPILKLTQHTAVVKAIAWSPHQSGLLVSVCNLAWSKNVNELVSTHGYSQYQIMVWKYPSLAKVACQSLGPLKMGGAVIGIDLKKVKVPSLYCDARVQTVCADIKNLPKHQVRALSPQQQGFSVILSDMCPPVSGISIKDAVLSAELGKRALDLAVGSVALSDTDTNDMDAEGQSDGSTSDSNDGGVLRPGGHLVIKLLESEDVKEFSRICKLLFKKASWLRPKATRSSSREIYLLEHSGDGLNAQPGEEQLKGSSRRYD